MVAAAISSARASRPKSSASARACAGSSAALHRPAVFLPPAGTRWRRPGCQHVQVQFLHATREAPTNGWSAPHARRSAGRAGGGRPVKGGGGVDVVEDQQPAGMGVEPVQHGLHPHRFLRRPACAARRSGPARAARLECSLSGVSASSSTRAEYACRDTPRRIPPPPGSCPRRPCHAPPGRRSPRCRRRDSGQAVQRRRRRKASRPLNSGPRLGYGRTIGLVSAGYPPPRPASPQSSVHRA